MSKLHGASYEIKHCTSKARDKKHASDLSPFPAKLIPFRPLDGANNQFGQLHCKFKEHPYREAGITGFTPPMPFVVPAQFLTTDNTLQFTWPTLAELNKEMLSELGIDVGADVVVGDSAIHSPGLYTGPPPTSPPCSIPAIPLASILAQQIINSANKSFFISWKIGFSVR